MLFIINIIKEMEWVENSGMVKKKEWKYCWESNREKKEEAMGKRQVQRCFTQRGMKR